MPSLAGIFIFLLLLLFLFLFRFFAPEFLDFPFCLGGVGVGWDVLVGLPTTSIFLVARCSVAFSRPFCPLLGVLDSFGVEMYWSFNPLGCALRVCGLIYLLFWLYLCGTRFYSSARQEGIRRSSIRCLFWIASWPGEEGDKAMSLIYINCLF